MKQMNIKYILLSERIQSQKAVYRLSSFMTFQKRESCDIEEQSSGCQELRRVDDKEKNPRDI